DGRPLPIDFQIAGIFGVEGALAVAQTRDEGPRAFLAQDVAVRQAPLADRTFDDGCETPRDVAEEPGSGFEEFIRRIGAGTAVPMRRLRLVRLCLVGLCRRRLVRR